MPLKFLQSFILIFLTCPLLHAEVRLPALFCDHMMIQCDVSIRVWGWADPDEHVTVSLNGQKKSTRAGKEGRWSLTLDPIPAGGPYEITVVDKTGLRVIQDVLAGEVWLCSGQSNMFWPVKLCKDAQKEIAQADWPEIRLFTVEQAISDEPKADCKGTWQSCSPQNVPEFSAVAYYFGREIYKRLKVPVGLIHSSWRGTEAECWISKPALQAHPQIFQSAVQRWEQVVADYPARKSAYDEGMAQYKKARADWLIQVKEAEKKGVKRPIQPSKPHEWKDPVTSPAPHRLYNAMIAPLIPYTIQGVLWYQGEANAPRAFQYRTLFPALIADWRKAWGQGDFPFIFAQIAWWYAPQRQMPLDNPMAELREAQLNTSRTVPKTAMAVMYDFGAERDVHFGNKQEAGLRLALCALAVAYGQTHQVYSGPVFKSMTVDGGKVRLAFDHVGGVLVLKEGAAASFCMAGKSRKFAWAEAKIENDTLVVRSPEVPDPVAVRYLWNEGLPCVLYNKNGLPATPFRTDDWPGKTDKIK